MYTNLANYGVPACMESGKHTNTSNALSTEDADVSDFWQVDWAPLLVWALQEMEMLI